MSGTAMAEVPNTFLYFAYGSNLLKKRIHINNPSAEFLGIGKLEGHQLDFMGYSNRWGGCSATIVPTQGEHIWGAIWRLDNKDMPALDNQEGVGVKWYFPRTVPIILPDGTNVHCRTYQQTKNPPPRRPGENIPQDRLPSITYMDVIVKGAIECQMPDEYIELLKNIPNNGNKANEEMLDLLKENSLNTHRIEAVEYSPTVKEFV
ncbi:gamma-glutamylcyclotransferase-like isoform X2 [Hyposmocoma kahamanoa]|uniref:gamma-glutamylcyclotransferase-like isoform X2 n=1 Tax=Hyposmocoma kahamanoa TaxID=1477025 RepID=UPI000E6D970A|nr:gamma-glutamylcyclotransferase-like isoform X2 [Hyposmocoma kahamanoa]